MASLSRGEGKAEAPKAVKAGPVERVERLVSKELPYSIRFRDLHLTGTLGKGKRVQGVSIP
jgi:hypothetical protein